MRIKKRKVVEAAIKTKQDKTVELEVVSDDGSADNIWLRFECCSGMKTYLKKKSNREIAVGFYCCPFCGKLVKSNNN